MGSDTIRIFIGSDASQLLASRVLEWSLRKYSSLPLEIQILDASTVPQLTEPLRRRQRTGFSFIRFAIPELCAWQGRAIYLDADMQVFADIAEVWCHPMNGKGLVCTVQSQTPDAWKGKNIFQPGRQFSVMLLDCSRLNWQVSDIFRDYEMGKVTYEDIMFKMTPTPNSEIDENLPAEWNHMETYIPGRTKLLHYTVGYEQPWLNDRNARREIWMKDFREALNKGAITNRDVTESIRQGYGKPALLKELKGVSFLVKVGLYLMYLKNKLMRAFRERLPFGCHA